MAVKSLSGAPLRTRPSDGAADLGLYGAPLAIGAPIVIAAAEGTSVRASSASPADALDTVRQPVAHSPPPSPAWWFDDSGHGGIASLGAISSKSGESVPKAWSDHGTDGKNVVVHIGTHGPISEQPLTHIEPVPRADAGDPPTAAPAPDPADGVVSSDQASLVAATATVAANAVEELRSADGTLQAVAGLATETVSTTVDALGSLLADLGPVGGSDPLGGVATLVNLVGAADLVDLAEITGPVNGLLVSLADDAGTLEAGALGSLDLQEPSPADVLLGIADPQHGPLGLIDSLVDDVI